ncbi:hypothetical protein H0O03_03460 [Candidatus Micrarchaeota archaeon]|nr:hypothetical protein [Candidatus Micrarchaeota archaeon]
MKKELLLIALVSLVLAGCVQQAQPTPTPQPSMAPLVSVRPSSTPSASPTPEPASTPEPTAEVTATPEPTPAPIPARCLITAIPSEGTKFVHANAVANFYDLTPMPAFAVFSCEYSNETLTVPIMNTTAHGYCSFHLKNNSLTTGTITASAGGVSCNATVTVLAPVFATCPADYAACLTVQQSIGRLCSLSPNVTEDCGYYEGDSMKCYNCTA